MSFTVRLLKESDLMNGFFETLSNLTEVGEIAKDVEKAKEIFMKSQDQKYTFVAAKEETNEIIGTSSILIEQKFIHNGACVGHIEDVAVKKEYEKQGIGSALLRKCIEKALFSNCYKVILDCNEHNAAFYSKFGFCRDCLCLRLNI